MSMSLKVYAWLPRWFSFTIWFLAVMFLMSCGRGSPCSVGVALIVLLKLYSFISMSISDACGLYQCMVDQYSSLRMAILRQAIHMRSVNLLRNHDNGCCYHACDCCIHSIFVSHSHAFQLFVTLKNPVSDVSYCILIHCWKMDQVYYLLKRTQSIPNQRSDLCVHGT